MDRLTKYIGNRAATVGDMSYLQDLRYVIDRLAELEDAEEQQNKGCDFCCYADYPDGKLYPKVGYTFYAGFSQQVQVDEFHEEETEEINFCPMCGRKLKESANG